MATLWGWSLGAGIIFGLSLSVASTVVLLRALEDRDMIKSNDGRIAIGWLVVEDLLMVLTLVLLPALTGVLGGDLPNNGGSLWPAVGITIGKVVLFIGLMLIAGVRFFPWLLSRVERTGSRELFTLAVIALALGVAFGSAKLFGVSFALGAFFAGVVVNESDLSHRAARDLQPLQDAFTVLFFVAVGMLFDPSILIRQPLQVLAVLAIVVFGKSLAAFGIVRVLGGSMRTALIVSAALAQIGEFSFILAGLGVNLRLLPAEGLNLIVAGALLSITFNPAVFSAAIAFAGREDKRRQELRQSAKIVAACAVNAERASQQATVQAQAPLQQAMKAIQGYHLIKPEDLHWRPSNLMKIPNADYLERTGSENIGARLWRLPPKSANTLHKHIRSEEFYFVLEGTGRMRVGDETLTVPKYGGVLVAPEQLRQVFNDTDDEVLWLIVGAPEELEFLQGSKSKMDLSLIYPVDPKQLPNELAGVEWPTKS